MIWIAQWILNALALYIVARIVPGIALSSFGAAMVAIIVMSLVNMFIKPILFLLTLPVTVVTLGLFTLILNALMFLLVGNLTPGFYVAGVWPALVASVLYWAITSIFNGLVANS
jgi:putative membrane protein